MTAKNTYCFSSFGWFFIVYKDGSIRGSKPKPPLIFHSAHDWPLLQPDVGSFASTFCSSVRTARGWVMLVLSEQENVP